MLNSQDALVACIRANERHLRSLALRILGDHHAADDAVQEGCLRALRALDAFRGDASMASWLRRITSNVCLDELRRRRCRPIAIDMSDEVPVHAPLADFADSYVDRAGLADALAALPAAQREAFMVVEVLGLGYTEAGTLMGLPKGTVGSRVHRAKAAIRDSLGPVAESVPIPPFVRAAA